MKKIYTVFSAHRVPVQAVATLPGGAQVSATVDAFEVQMTANDGASGTVKLTYTDPTEFDAAEALFVVGAEIGMTPAAA